MSWLARTIANSLRLDDAEEYDEEEEEEEEQQQQLQKHAPTAEPTNTDDPKSPPKPESEPSSSSSSSPTARGVKEDLSELKQTLSRQFWGVASFLAPPSEPKPDPSRSEPQISDPDGGTDEDLISGIRSDFAEISGRFRSGISKLSGNKAVSEITKMASNFLQLGSEEERPLSEYDLNGVVGVTEEVVAFARNIAMHPETWLDFPLPDDPESYDFDLSDAQQEHALVVERLVPRLAALRLELCPEYLHEGSFWKIYFVLLHPKLSKNDAVILSTPQIMEVRAMLTLALDKRNKEKKELNISSSGNVQSIEAEHHLSVPTSVQQESHLSQESIIEADPPAVATDVKMHKEPVQSKEVQVVSDVKMDKQPVQSNEVQIVEKSVVKEAPVNPASEQSSSSSVNRFSYEMDEDEADDWLKEDTSEMVGGTGTSVPIVNEDDVSFSDLEDDDDNNNNVRASHKKATSSSDSSTKGSRDWVQLSRNSIESLHADSEHASARNSVNKDSNDWLDVDDIDAM